MSSGPVPAALWTAGVRRVVFENGLTVLAQPVPGAPAVAIVTRVQAGFFDEPDRWSGISHVLEHMFFKGTPTRGVGEIARGTKAAGGYLNAATSYDYTSYYAVLPGRGLARALEIQADALRHALIDADELRREIGVIIQEARRKLDSPSAVVQETLHALLYDHHWIRRWRIGAEAVLQGFTRDDLVGYYRSRYVPSRTILVIAGGLDPDEAIDRARDRYADWPAAVPEIDRSPTEPPRRQRRAATLRGDVRQSNLVLGWRGVPARHPDELALDLAATLLSTGRASRLYRALRQTGIVSSVSAWNYSPAEVGVFAIAADLEPDRLEEAAAAIAGQVARLAAHGPESGELERARTLVRARWARRFESAEGRASALAAAEAEGDVQYLEHDYVRLLTLAGPDVRDAVARHLDPLAASGVVYHPAGRGHDLTLAGLDAAFSGLPVDVRPTPMAPRIAPRSSLPTRGARTADVLHVELPGVDLLVRRRVGTPTVTLGVYRVRPAPDPARQAGLGTLVARSAIRGAGDFSAVELADAFEQLGGSVTPSIRSEWLGFEASVLVEHLATAASLLDLVLRAPRQEDEAIAIERSLLADDARQAADDMFRFPVQLAFHAAFGDTGYGLPLLGSGETVSALTAADVRRWHCDLLGAGRTTVIAVGDVAPEAVADQLAGCFSGHAAAAAIEFAAAAGGNRPAAPRLEVLERLKAQTAMAMLFPGPDRRAPDRYAVDIWSTIAGGLGGRLFEALRDRRSLAYTVAAFPWQRRHAGAVLTYIAMAPDREEEARAAMLAELATFRSVAPSEDEVRESVNYLTGLKEVARQSASALVSEILDAWLEGAGLEELADPGAPYRAVTAAAIRAAAERYLDPEGRVEGIVRGTTGPRG